MRREPEQNENVVRIPLIADNEEQYAALIDCLRRDAVTMQTLVQIEKNPDYFLGWKLAQLPMPMGLQRPVARGCPTTLLGVIRKLIYFRYRDEYATKVHKGNLSDKHVRAILDEILQK